MYVVIAVMCEFAHTSVQFSSIVVHTSNGKCDCTSTNDTSSSSTYIRSELCSEQVIHMMYYTAHIAYTA
jgi:UDP-glucose 4-epimerase